ncbi:hypothetical protein C8J47_1323 [Sphingomonas sp. PP-F2F-G114-C0414]|uniref:hypothetical protein n=1 Tax=Sphingomonas sp. PP-F2F-G114-C0414 TaxID=2135662 RepID=UPI000F2380C5|nr:hypothetical protein [Sphingomonas sp. PP-F2F-G114-C0414]RMB35802.1 hypothetical protein C8J47_1323 [Sphingomonas sp. PP-F2F-G114-C0414]
MGLIMIDFRTTFRLANVSTGALLLAACVNPSAKIATSLEGYGFQPAQSQCVGDRLEANLSIGQLQQLGRAAKASRQGDTTPGRLTIDDFVRVSGQVKDAKVPLEVGKAAAACRLMTDPASPL